jgi:phosphotransferase system enzyme I (PtsP)
MPTPAVAAAREILTGLHALMARRGSPQAKLDHVVDLIAGALQSEVCSIYLMSDNLLELYATHGLRKEAVHVTRLALGEGLVGTIAREARILNLAGFGAVDEFGMFRGFGEVEDSRLAGDGAD